MNAALVAILMGSRSDKSVMDKAGEILSELGIPSETLVMSAHRQPELVSEYAAAAAGEGIKVIICGAGMAAHLAGAVAAKTILPVIGVPVKSGALEGIDALLSTAQMPGGVPVATVAIDGAKNAAYLAAEIIALNDADVRERLLKMRQEQAGG